MSEARALPKHGVFEPGRTRERFERVIRQLGKKLPNKLQVTEQQLEEMISAELGVNVKVTDLLWYDCLVGYVATVQFENTSRDIMLQLGVEEVSLCGSYKAVPQLTVVEPPRRRDGYIPGEPGLLATHS